MPRRFMIVMIMITDFSSAVISVFFFVYNGLGIPVALGLLYPFIGLLLSPLLAALAMSLSSLTVISNANRLKLWKPKEVV